MFFFPHFFFLNYLLFPPVQWKFPLFPPFSTSPQISSQPTNNHNTNSMYLSLKSYEYVNMCFHKFWTLFIVQDTGLWGIYFVTDAMNQENMIFNISNEWMRLCNNVTDFEVSKLVTVDPNQLDPDPWFFIFMWVSHEFLLTGSWGQKLNGSGSTPWLK